MANPVKGVTRLRPEPYDPDAQDGDGDGIVQERTAWERPVGTRLLDANGDPIARGRSLTERPAGIQIVDKNGRKINYRPSYSPNSDTPAGGGQGGTRSPLSDLGARSLAEMGLPTLRSLNAPPAPQNSPVEPSKTPDPAPPSTKLPEPPKKPRNPSLAPFDGRAQELADQAGGDWTKFAELLNAEGYVAFDYETTGFDDGNIPVQVGAVRVKDGKIVERLNLFMNPQRGLSQWSKDNLLDANGQPLTDEWLAQQQSIEDAHRQLVDFLGDSILVAQYIPFDEEVLTRTLKGLGIDYAIKGKIDTKELAAQVLPKGDGTTGPLGHSLKDLSDFLGVRLDNWHTADADSAAAARVLMGTLQAARDRNADPNILNGQWQKARYAERVAQHAADMGEYRKKKEEYDRLVQQGYDLAPTERLPEPAPRLDSDRVLDNPRFAGRRSPVRFTADEPDTPEARAATKTRVTEIGKTVRGELDEVRALLDADPLAAHMGGDDQFIKQNRNFNFDTTERGERLNAQIVEAGAEVRADVARRFGSEIRELEAKADAADAAYQKAWTTWRDLEAPAQSRHQDALERLETTDFPLGVETRGTGAMTTELDLALGSISPDHTAAVRQFLTDNGLVEDGKVRVFLASRPTWRGFTHETASLDPEDPLIAGKDAVVADIPLEDIVAITKNRGGGTAIHFAKRDFTPYRSTQAEHASLPLASLEQAASQAVSSRREALEARDDVRRRVARAYRQVLSDIRGMGPRKNAERPTFETAPSRSLPTLTRPDGNWDRGGAAAAVNDIRASWSYLPTVWAVEMSRTPIRVEATDRGMYAPLIRNADGTVRQAAAGEAMDMALLRLPVSDVDDFRGGRFDQGAVMHELMHMAEDHFPEIKLAESSFLYGRNKGEMPVLLGPSESGHPDEFFSSYVGRTYGGAADSNYEVLSMGMQALFAPQVSVHSEFLDDEYLDWVVGVLATVGKSR